MKLQSVYKYKLLTRIEAAVGRVENYISRRSATWAMVSHAILLTQTEGKK